MVEGPLYKQVVAGYEETERGEDARILAERIVARDGGELKMVHVEKGSPADALQALAETGEADLIVLGSTHPAAAQAGAEAGPDFQTRLHEAVSELPPELRALPVLERGDPVKRLIEASEVGVDLLVLGSRGFGPVLRLLIGSVSSRVIRGAPC